MATSELLTHDLQVHLLPNLVTTDSLRGGVAVVLDVLRASTTITHALANGALTVVPTATIPEAHSAATVIAKYSRPSADSEVPAAVRAAAGVVLGGERSGSLIPGFDFDNSPSRYTANAVGGKSLVFTTTNGTQALLKCRESARTLVGCFSNLHSVISLLATETRPIHLVCAGTDGAISTDDALCAGAIATGVWASRQWPRWMGDELRLVMDLFTCRCQPLREIVNTLRESQGGRNLIELGLEADIDHAARWDLCRVVPEFDPATGHIRPAADVPAEPKQVLMAPRE